jgi:hypothetical protein
VLRLGEPDHQQLLLLLPGGLLREEVMAQAGRPVGQSADHEHLFGRERGRDAQLVEDAAGTARLDVERVLPSHEPGHRIAVLEFRGKRQPHAAVGLRLGFER